MHQDERVSGLGFRVSGRSRRPARHRRGRSGASSCALDTNRYQRCKQLRLTCRQLVAQSVNEVSTSGVAAPWSCLLMNFLNESAMYNWLYNICDAETTTWRL